VINTIFDFIRERGVIVVAKQEVKVMASIVVLAVVPPGKQYKHTVSMA
jgi:hypothetical protein